MSRFLTLAAAALLLLPARAAHAQVTSEPTPTVASPGGESVTLSPGDVLKVEIWREKDLSGEFPVDDRGSVTLPLIGERRVTGIPMGQLRDQLLADYRQSLRNPSITIIPLRRITVLGEVNKPGAYMMDPTVSLAGAVALAQGATPNGDVGRIRIVRNGTVIQQRVGPAATLNTADVRSGDEIFVERRRWLDRNSATVVSVVIPTLLSILATRLFK